MSRRPNPSPTPAEDQLRISFILDVVQTPELAHLKHVVGHGARPRELLRLAIMGMKYELETQALAEAARQAGLVPGGGMVPAHHQALYRQDSGMPAAPALTPQAAPQVAPQAHAPAPAPQAPVAPVRPVAPVAPNPAPPPQPVRLVEPQAPTYVAPPAVGTEGLSAQDNMDVDEDEPAHQVDAPTRRHAGAARAHNFLA